MPVRQNLCKAGPWWQNARMHTPRPTPPAAATWLVDTLKRGCGTVHCMGVCGVGMAGVAALLHDRGLTVSGCDRVVNPLGEWLRERGIAVVSGHAREHIAAGTAGVIRSAAVPQDHPEIRRAADMGVPVLRRGQALPCLLEAETERATVAVSGTHGKTSTATFLAQLLRWSGHDPGWCIGGENADLRGVAHMGSDTALVVEADESDGTLRLYRPDIAIVTNIEFDHMEHFAGVEDFEDCFRRVVAQTGQRVVYCGDDARAARVCSPGGARADTLAYGRGADCAVQARDIDMAADGSTFTWMWHGERLGHARLTVPGAHNVLNALAAACVALEVGVPAQDVCALLPRLSLPRRRFEIVAHTSGGVVISDYAHHPAEIAALVRTARRSHRGRLRAVFQPHRYSRTRALGADFPPAFERVDELILAPVYPASESRLVGGSIGDLYRHFRDGASAGPGDVKLARSLDEVWPYYRETLAETDRLLVVGAGDVERVAQQAVGELADVAAAGIARAHALAADLQARLVSSQVKVHEPLAHRTGLRVGGAADLWVEAADADDLARVVTWAREEGIPLHVLGAGFNALVSDLGVRGVTVRLTGEPFRRLEHRDGVLVAGAAVPLSRLVDWTASHACAGFAFLEGIPGTVGGAGRMNAGAWGRQLSDVVAWIRCLNMDGNVSTVPVEELGMTYRNCRALEGAVLLDAGFVLAPGNEGEIAARRQELAARRAWMNGLRSAGSVFRNPPEVAAGRLLDESGFKGHRLGGAEVSSDRANFIFTRPDARASDVAALIDIMTNAMWIQKGRWLETEVKWLA